MNGFVATLSLPTLWMLCMPITSKLKSSDTKQHEIALNTLNYIALVQLPYGFAEIVSSTEFLKIKESNN